MSKVWRIRERLNAGAADVVSAKVEYRRDASDGATTPPARTPASRTPLPLSRKLGEAGQVRDDSASICNPSDPIRLSAKIERRQAGKVRRFRDARRASTAKSATGKTE